MDNHYKQKPHQMHAIVRQLFQNAPQKFNISRYGLLLLFYGMLLTFSACQRKIPPENPAAWKKIQLNFKKMDEAGLTGSFDSKVAVNYEFCIPAQKEKWKSVQKIDSTARLYPQSKGRIRCKDDQWLIIGSTHQPRYKRVLYDLANLPYVERIEETFWE